MSRGKVRFLASLALLGLSSMFLLGSHASAQVLSNPAAGLDNIPPVGPVEQSLIINDEEPSVTIVFARSADDYVRQVPVGGDFTSGGTFVETNDVAGYRIDRLDDVGQVAAFDPSDNPGLEFAEIEPGVLAFIDFTVDRGGTYIYTVVAYDAAGNEGSGDPLSADIGGVVDAPAAPSSLTLELSYETQTSLFWLDIEFGSSPDDLGSSETANLVDNYRVEVNLPDTEFSDILEASGALSYEMPGLTFQSEGDITVSVYALDAEQGLDSDPIQASVSAVVPPSVAAQMAIPAEVTFSELEDEQQEIITQSIGEQIAAAAQVPVERVVIKSIRDGSLIVDFEIIESDDPEEPEAISPQEAFANLETQIEAEPETFTENVTEDIAEADPELAEELQLATPVIGEIVQSTVHLGEVYKGGELRATQTGTNELDDDDTIAISAAGEGFSVSPASLELGPGEEGSFDIVFTATANGDFSGTVQVRTGDLANPGNDITVTATVLPDPPSIEVSTDAIAFDDLIVGDQPLTDTFTISNTGEVDLEVTLIVLGERVFTPVPTIISVPGGGDADVEVSFAPNDGVSFESSLRISHNDPDVEPLSIALSGTGIAAIPEIDLAESALDFGDVTVGETSTQNLTIGNPGTASLEGTITLSGADSYSSSLLGDYSLSRGEELTIEISFAPTLDGDSDAALTITSNDPDEAELVVALSGTGKGTPEIELAESALGFGGISLDEIGAQSLTISNSGTASLEGTITLSGAGTFTASVEGAYSLAPGEALTIDISFDPVEAGASAGSITITSNDADDSELVVNLVGSGIDDDIALVPEIDLSESSVGFGDVLIGETATASATILNLGTASLEGTISLSGDATFSASVEGEFAVAVGEVLTIDITFAPIEDISSEGTITITSNDADDSELTIILSGSGSTGVQVCVDAGGTIVVGDFDGNGAVNFQDFFKFADNFGTSESSANWDPAYDLDANGSVNFQDFFKFADDFGKQCTYQ